MKYKFYSCERDSARNSFAYESPFLPNQKGVSFSKLFCNFFSEKFEECFVNETGLKPSLKVNITRPNRDNSPEIYERGKISKLNPVLWIMPKYYDDISFCWRSKSCNIVQPWDEVFDVNDMEYWMENLKPKEYWAYIGAGKEKHPFSGITLPFELKVFDFGTEMNVRIFTTLQNFEFLSSALNNAIAAFNDKSESLGRKDGVVHNWSWQEEENYLNLRIDTGSSGINALKKILLALKKNVGIKKVEFDL